MLMWGNYPPLATLTIILRDHWLSLASLLTIAIYILTFRGQDNRIRRKACRAHELAPLPNQPTPMTISNPTPHLPIIFHYSPVQGKIHDVAPVPILCHPRAPQEELFPLCCAKNIFSRSRTLVLPFAYYRNHAYPSYTTPSDSVTLLIYNTSIMTGKRGAGDVLWLGSGQVAADRTSFLSSQTACLLHSMIWVLHISVPFVSLGGKIGGFASLVVILSSFPLLFPPPTAPLINASILPWTQG